LNSLFITTADHCALAASDELLVDRQRLATALNEAIRQHSRIEVRREEVTELSLARPAVVASGPLTSQPLARALYRAIGQPYRFFYRASAPIVALDDISSRGLMGGCRYDPDRDSRELNCLLDEAGFVTFCAALVEARTTVPEAADPGELLDRSLPVELMARQSGHLLRRGPLTAGRLTSPGSGKRLAAAVRLVPEDSAGQLWRLAGMGTGLTPDEQQRVFGQLPGLEGLEIVRPGQAVRSVYLPTPAVLTPAGRVLDSDGLFLAGQLLGTANYVEAAATGWLAGVNATRWAQRRKPALLPRATMLGSLVHRLTATAADDFASEPVNFSLLPVTSRDIDLPRDERRQMQIKRSEGAIAEFVAQEELELND